MAERSIVGGKPLISRPEERPRAPAMTALGLFLGCAAYGMVNRIRRRNIMFGELMRVARTRRAHQFSSNRETGGASPFCCGYWQPAEAYCSRGNACSGALGSHSCCGLTTKTDKDGRATATKERRLLALREIRTGSVA